MPEQFHPTVIVQAYRDLHPGKFDDLEPGALLDAIKELDPDTYQLVNPLLIGAELLPSAPPPRKPQPLPTPAAQPSWFDTGVTTALRVGPGIAGGMLGAAGGPLGVAVGGGAGMGAGDLAAQQYEKSMGLRQAFSPSEVAISAGLGAVPMGEVTGMGLAGRTATRAGQNALLGTAGTLASDVVTGTPPSWGQVGTSAGVGAAFGAGMHGVMEGVGAVQQARVTAAAQAQYAAEEAALAAKWHALYGAHPRPSVTGDFHTAIQAKSYLDELAALGEPPVPIPPMQPGLTESPYTAAPPSLMLPEQAGPGSPDSPNLIRAYPPGAAPNLELVGSSAPPASRIVSGGQNLSAAPPPRPSFAQALESSLQTPPGPPRLVRPLVLSSQEGAAGAVPRGMAEAQPELLPPPRPQFSPALEQTGEMGGAPPTREQPRLPAVDRGVSTERTYPSGANVGPRRTPRQEAHGTSRPVRRQVRTGGKVRYETVPSDLPAEDPGTYPPEVRRELARMAAELQELQYLAPRMQRGPVDAEHTYTRATPGAPVYHDILAEAGGARAHATRAEVLKDLRAALLEGRGGYLSDAAAKVARQRLAQEARGAKGTSHILPPGAGDDLIGWVDAAGNRALPDQDLSEFQRAVRDMDDGELWDSLQMGQRIGRTGLGDTGNEFYDAVVTDAARRGLIQPEQLQLLMEPDAAAATAPDASAAPAAHPSPAPADAPPSRPPGLDIGREVAESQVALNAKLRGTPADIPDNPVARQLESERRAADAAPPARPQIGDPARMQESIWQRLQNEEGVLILRPPPPAGDRVGLKKWLKSNEDAHGGAPWFSRVEHHLEAGDHDQAWKAATSAYIRSYSSAWTAATPKQRDLLDQAVRGTPLQSDMHTQIIGQARMRAGVGTAPPVKGMPPSIRVSQAGAARGRATLGPAGIMNPGPRQHPLSTAAPALRAATLDREVVRLIMEGTTPEGISTVPGNTDTYLRLFRQVGEQIYRGDNLKLLREAGVRIPPEELAQHFNATISDAGRTLNLMAQFAQTHVEVLTDAAERMSMGGALHGMLGEGGGPPRYAGKGRGELSPAGQRATQEVIDQLAKDTNAYQASALANDLQKRKTIGPLRALHDASYAFMLSKWNTAVRNYTVYAGRYGVEALDHALTTPIAQLLGDAPTATLSSALLKERGISGVGRPGTAVTPRRAWSEDLQGIYDFTTDNLNRLGPKDARRAISLLLQQPERAAEYLGAVGGEDLSQEFNTTPVLRHLVNPKVQRFLTMFNRAQEFSARATVFDATTRALLRAKGLDPTQTLLMPTPELIEAVGGQQAFDNLLFTATSQALDATFAGRTSKDSIPGALIRFINDAWPLKLGVPFPRFNFSSAPRWIYDHSPAALLDWVRFPLDRAGITAARGGVGGGRLYRGVRAQEIQQADLPALALKIGQAERQQGVALQELLSTQREYQIRARQISRLEQRAQQGLPDVQDTLTQAQDLQTQLGRRRERLKSEMQESRTVVGDLKSEQKKLLDRVVDATGINAPNYAQSLARMGVGTVGLLGAAWVVRSQDAAQGTRWYEYRIDREGKDPVILDFRPFAPFAQYLFVADVANDFYRHTNWSAVHDAVMTEEEGMVASPLDWSRAMWANYEGKYTEAELGTQFAQAFLSISRAAGTTLTLTDLLTQNGWPSLEDAARASVGTIGQFFSRFTVPGQMTEALPGYTSVFPEEAKVRTPPKATIEDWERPLAQPFTNVPGVKQLVPETISQTTGKPIATEYPFLRGFLGIGTTPRDFVTEEVRRVGVPGQSVFIRETGDVGLDRMVAESYARILQQELPAVLEAPEYQSLGTPARQRDYLQRYIFPALKRAALGEAREGVGEEAFTAATVRGENARHTARQLRLLEDLEAGEPAVAAGEAASPESTEPPGPPTTPPAGVAPPPPPPF